MKNDSFLVAFSFAFENNLFEGHTIETFKKQSFVGCTTPVSVKLKIEIFKEYLAEKELDSWRKLLAKNRLAL